MLSGVRSFDRPPPHTHTTHLHTHTHTHAHTHTHHRVRGKMHTTLGMVEDFIGKYCVTTVATMVIMVPFFRRLTGVSDDMRRNADVLSRMRYMTSITVFQLGGMAGVAFFVQRVKKLKSYARRLQTLFEVWNGARVQSVIIYVYNV
jgi:hypothetical protein